jgi:hypothetical protein
MQVDFFLLLPFFSIFSLSKYKGVFSYFYIQLSPYSFDFFLFFLSFFIDSFL